MLSENGRYVNGVSINIMLMNRLNQEMRLMDELLKH
jgi:hypothetical protein